MCCAFPAAYFLNFRRAVPRRDRNALKMNRRIVIVGFMGCGKTTVAQALADHLACEMIDLDSFITETCGRSPAEIIGEESEGMFREIETKALHDVLANRNACVIALGGGTWTIERNRELIGQHDCLTVWLDVPFETCWQRITSSGETIRPLAPDRQVAHELYQTRQALYQLTSVRINATDAQFIDEIIGKILTQTL